MRRNHAAARLILTGATMASIACGGDRSPSRDATQVVPETPRAPDPGSLGTQPAWRMLRTTMPHARTGAAAFAIGDRLYVAGGQRHVEFLANVDVLDVATGRWTAAPDIPLGRTFTATNGAVIGSMLYLVTGNARGYCTDRADGFDIATGRWTSLPSAPVARCHAASVALGDRVYVLGGWNTSSTVHYTRVDVFDPSARRWLPGDPLPEPRGGMAAAVIGGVVYLVGGSTLAQRYSGDLLAYDPRTRRWTRGAPMPTPRSATAAAVVGGRLYVMGGLADASDGPAALDVVESYDPATDRWRQEGPLPVALAYPSAAGIGRTIYLLGGQSRTDATALPASVYALVVPP